MNEKSRPSKILLSADKGLLGHMAQEKIASMLANMTEQEIAKELEHLLRGKERITLLGHFVGGIAHQILDPLSGINIYLGILEKICSKEAKKKDLERISEIVPKLQSASHRIENIVKDIIGFSRVREPKFNLTDINRPVAAAIMISSASMQKDGIKLHEKLVKDLPQCHADPRLIKQALLILITNACNAMKNMGKNKKIEVGSSLGKNSVVVNVSDSRPAAGLDLKEKVFDPSYANNGGNPEIGLSLNIVDRVIGEHGGSFGVFGSRWSGAEFRIQIPLEKGTNKV